MKKQVCGNKKPAILADSVEALIAAIYLDSNLENCEKFIIENLKNKIKKESKNVGMKDYKTVLQEELQKKGNIKIEYNIIKEIGPDHDKKFISEIKVKEKQIAVGKGKTKKEAEANAAKNTLKILNNKNID